MDPSKSSLRRPPWRAFRLMGEYGWALLAIAIACFMVGATVWQVQESWEQEVAAATSRLTDVAGQDVARYVEQVDLILRTVMAGDQTPASQNLTADQRNTLLFERTPRDRYIEFIDVLDANGGVLATLTPDKPATSWARRDYFAAQHDSTTNGLLIGWPYSIAHENGVGFTVSRRITTNDGKFAGVVVLGIRLAFFRDQFSRYDLREGESLTLLRNDSTVLMRLPFDVRAIGHPVEPASPFDAFARAEQPPFVARDKTDHIERRYVFNRVGTLPLVLSIATPVEDRFLSPVLWWGLPGILLIGALCVVLMRQLLQRHQVAPRESLGSC
jgi:hypothetical protein